MNRHWIQMAEGLALAVALALTAGCLQVEQTLTLNSDGSGTLDLTYGMSEQALGEMAAMTNLVAEMDKATGQKPGSPADLRNPFVFDEQAIRQKAAQYQKQGIKLVRLGVGPRGNWKFASMTVAFDNLAALTKTGLLPNSALTLKRQKNGNYILFQKLLSPGSSVNLRDPATQKDLGIMLTGLRLVLRVNTPGRVLNANTAIRGENTALWDADVDKTPELLQKFVQEGAVVTFDGTGLDLPEISFQTASGSGTNAPPAAVAR